MADVNNCIRPSAPLIGSARIIICTLFLLLGLQAVAEDAPGDMRFADVADRLCSKDPAQRLATSRVLLDAGPKATVEVMRKLRAALVDGASVNSSQCKSSEFALELMNILAETLERDRKVVHVFRANDDCELVRKLVQLSLSEEKTTRGLATIVLANIVDNTTLPLVTDAVQGDRISKNSLLNLLGVIRVKADYALVDNRQLIEAAVKKVQQEWASRIGPELTQAVEDIERELKKNNRRETAKGTFGKDYCASQRG